MISLRLGLGIMFLLFSSFVSAQTITESWMRQAGISCGGGLSFAVQGEIDAAVLRRLKLGSANGSASIQYSQANELLAQFKEEQKQDIYVNYVSCLMALMTLATKASNLPPREVTLKSSVAVASIETVTRGQRFVMEPGGTVAVKDHSLIFTVDGFSNSGQEKRVDFTWSNSELQRGSQGFVKQGAMVVLGKGCSLVPYQVNTEKKQVSFLSNC